MTSLQNWEIFAKPVRAVLVGAGRRGIDIFGGFAEKYTKHLKYIAVVEPNEERRNYFGNLHKIPEDYRYDSLKSFFANPPPKIEAAINSTDDKSHFITTKFLLKGGYHVLLEKPIATTFEECEILEQLAIDNDRILMVCHVLRYSPFFKRIKATLDSNTIGQIKKIDLIENIGHSHFVHSYVRGNWNNSNTSGPISLTKTCHDFDIIVWLLGFKNCQSLFSYSTKNFFSEENAPGNTPSHCTKGCNFRETCRYYAPDYYLNSNTIQARKRAVATNLDPKDIEKNLKDGPYGKCVYKCDNNVPGTQITTMSFDNNVVANLFMSSDQEESTRRIKIEGSKGSIEGCLVEGTLVLTKKNMSSKKLRVSMKTDPHGGGDYPLIYDFLTGVKNLTNSERTLISKSIMSHKLAFEAEKSRLQYIRKVKNFLQKRPPGYRS